MIDEAISVEIRDQAVAHAANGLKKIERDIQHEGVSGLEVGQILTDGLAVNEELELADVSESLARDEGGYRAHGIDEVLTEAEYATRQVREADWRKSRGELFRRQVRHEVEVVDVAKGHVAERLVVRLGECLIAHARLPVRIDRGHPLPEYRRSEHGKRPSQAVPGEIEACAGER